MTEYLFFGLRSLSSRFLTFSSSMECNVTIFIIYLPNTPYKKYLHLSLANRNVPVAVISFLMI